MYIAHIASELAPVAKVGGLGDAIYGLAKELVRLNHTVDILLPKYDCLNMSYLENLTIEIQEFPVFDGTTTHNNTIWSARCDGLRILLIEPSTQLFNQGMIYGCPDDTARFAYFSLVATAYLAQKTPRPDLLHLHDWPTALCSFLWKGPTLLTIHNLEYQGHCLPSLLAQVGLENKDNTLQDPTYPECINLLKGGIIAADLITTVSPNYQKEILTVEGSCGLHEILTQNQHKLSGILNGIDEEFWNPASDPYLAQTYQTHQVTTEETLDRVLSAKRANKESLCAQLKLRSSERPLVASITRLVPQKAPALIKAALLRTLEKGGQFVLLGTTQIPEIQKEFEELQATFSTHPDVAILLNYDEALSHLIFAAADLFIIPSLFEPCGLTQLIAMRYGTIPIARVTGGLADTVFDLETAAKPLNMRNGFTFDIPDTEGLHWALDRAFRVHEHSRELWRSLMIHGMLMDFSWKSSANQYVELYQKLLIRKKEK